MAKSVSQRYSEMFFMVEYEGNAIVFAQDETNVDEVYQAIKDYKKLVRYDECDDDLIDYLSKQGFNCSYATIY